MAIAALNKKKARFTNKLDLNEETSAVLLFEHSSIWCWNLDSLESRSEIPGKFWNVVSERGVEVYLDGLCEKWRSITQAKINILHAIKGRNVGRKEGLLDWWLLT
jgi:hypothetical protein